jgi:HEPN domain-containing protein
MNDKVLYWVELAEYDYETAKIMLETKRYLYVGFMLHQTIEKVLKGYYVSTLGASPPHTHNLMVIAQKSLIYENLSEKQKELLDFLDPLNIQARYPRNKEKLSKELDFARCSWLLGETEGLFAWIKAKL